MMTPEQVVNYYKQLDSALHNALTIHTKSDTIYTIRAKMLNLQAQCPHEIEGGTCKYCKKKF